MDLLLHNGRMANTYLSVPFSDKDAAKALSVGWTNSKDNGLSQRAENWRLLIPVAYSWRSCYFIDIR